MRQAEETVKIISNEEMKHWMESAVLVEDYEINPNTLYVRPIVFKGEFYSFVHESDGGEYITPCKPIDVVKRSCEFFGYDYEGQRKGTKSLT